MFSLSEENYLKTIFTETTKAKTVGTTKLAEKLKAKPASVTEMIQKISEKKLAKYTPYQGVCLTVKGKKEALKIIRKHRLWEYFLVNKLGFDWHEVHEIAEELEHIKSDLLIERLDSFLGYPKFDPHGDPIPDSNGTFKKHYGKSIFMFKENTRLKLCAVNTNDSQTLQHLKELSITIGKTFVLKKILALNQSIHLELKNKSSVILPKTIASALLVMRYE